MLARRLVNQRIACACLRAVYGRRVRRINCTAAYRLRSDLYRYHLQPIARNYVDVQLVESAASGGQQPLAGNFDRLPTHQDLRQHRVRAHELETSTRGCGQKPLDPVYSGPVVANHPPPLRRRNPTPSKARPPIPFRQVTGGLPSARRRSLVTPGMRNGGLIHCV